MLELMSLQALEVGSERRRELVRGSMRTNVDSGGGLRQAIGAAVVAIGERVAGKDAAPGRKVQASGDCIEAPSRASSGWTTTLSASG